MNGPGTISIMPFEKHGLNMNLKRHYFFSEITNSPVSRRKILSYGIQLLGKVVFDQQIDQADKTVCYTRKGNEARGVRGLWRVFRLFRDHIV